jgi:hypothetical protein
MLLIFYTEQVIVIVIVFLINIRKNNFNFYHLTVIRLALIVLYTRVLISGQRFLNAKCFRHFWSSTIELTKLTKSLANHNNVSSATSSVPFRGTFNYLTRPIKNIIHSTLPFKI